MNFKYITNSFVSYPFLTDSKVGYENILGKNKESYYNINLYNYNIKNNYSVFLDSWNANNIIIADIPFLLSYKSDASRYLWFDWQAKWSSIEVQYALITKYSLAGLPYLTKNFEYTTQLGDELNDSENYLLKIARVRKNYMPNWSYSPYFYSKILNWFNNNNKYYDILETSSLKTLLFLSSNYWKNYDLLTQNTKLATPSFSGLNTANKTTWTPVNGISAKYYTTSILVDILSKRETIYRTFFKNKSNIINIPKSLTVSLNNSIINEIKESYLFIDPTTYSSEVTREFL
jgi:hypothetical protein